MQQQNFILITFTTLVLRRFMLNHSLYHEIKKSVFYRISLVLLCLCSAVGVHASSSALEVSLDNSIDTELLIDGLPSSWSINVSPRNDIFVTDRSGSIIVYDEEWQKRQYITSISDLFAGGQGGFLDIAFHPDYISNGLIYLSYSTGNSDSNRLKIVRFLLPEEGEKITQIEHVFTMLSGKNTPVHYGGRMAFLPDNSLLITTGDGFDFREQAQIKSSHLGKILRVSETGEALKDNPFFLSQVNKGLIENGERPVLSVEQNYIYSLGHRNPQALLVTKAGIVISNEHGPAGGDEINIIESGKNYGWPIVTNGKDYFGALISPFTEYKGMRQPAHDWTPSIAPSGMVLYTGTKFPSLIDHLIVTSLKFKQLRALKFTNNEIKQERILLGDFEYRLRDIAVDKQGNILLLTDGSSAKIFKLISK